LLVDGSDCQTRAFATTVIYGPAQNEDWKEGTTDQSFRAYEGGVRVHPEFELRTDLHGDQITSRADLALIVLEFPVEEPSSLAVVCGIDPANCMQARRTIRARIVGAASFLE
jgi:hypothetical protein